MTVVDSMTREEFVAGGDSDRTILEEARRCVQRASTRGQTFLTEEEGYSLLRIAGIRTPQFLSAHSVDELDQLPWEHLPGDRIVVKISSPEILHKTDVGAVQVVFKNLESIRSAIEGMNNRIAFQKSFLLCEYVPHSNSPGSELLFNIRHTQDFGAIFTLCLGGTATEFFASSLVAESGKVILSPGFTDMDAALSGKIPVQLATGKVRGFPAFIDPDELCRLVNRFLMLMKAVGPGVLEEIEVNPMALTQEGPVALDVLCRLSAPAGPVYPNRPVEKIRNLLMPKSIAILGVSEKMNPGRIILRNVLAAGFPFERVYVIKRNLQEIDRCRCYPDINSLPEPVDLLILSIDALSVPQAIEQSIQQNVKSIILISSGIGERTGTEVLESKVRTLLAESRTSADRGPVLNGGNCLGNRSVPGRYNTLFIPSYKLPFPDRAANPLAILAQSGAFLVAKASKLSAIHPRYLISIGNQSDLTVGDYLSYLMNDPALRVFGCYVEGFRPGDGILWLEAAKRIIENGKTVVLYCAGRSPKGAQAASSHTASIAGNFAVVQELARQAGVLVANTLADFEDLILLSCFLSGKEIRGWRLAALSNAGFETVAMADHAQKFHFVEFSKTTEEHLELIFRHRTLDRIVVAKNPLDVTPILDDEAFAETACLILNDDGVDVAVIGCVPLTGRLNTLQPGESYPDDVEGQNSVASRLIRLFESNPKAWVCVVEGGPLYDPMAEYLIRHGLPVFRNADRAVRLFEMYCVHRRACVQGCKSARVQAK